ncbi:hypothetical protein A9404_01775 [Halothiobacillus diazotrophicus]|uniref:Uncharacterized protein n=1 Tax=Halothiobacillus diazotrophicus TaxID=1860122 RepID=A0A191ZEH8_9GAMM|nr:hypothetical protein [Halothiobacillus diazotrophicus]ANJ66273.1 hypothetical protein A9404_01775 [Halothiobacillus diazotrophicus]
MKIIDLEEIDRVVVFEKLEEAEKFCKNPEKFLRENGALQKNEPFNGMDFDPEELLKVDYSKDKAWRCHLKECTWTWCDIA